MLRYFFQVSLSSPIGNNDGSPFASAIEDREYSHKVLLCGHHVTINSYCYIK